MVHRYDYPLNGGHCWNCGRNYTHECCGGCKRDRKICDCVYICGFTYPTEQRNQFAKCRFFTNNMDDIVHKCKGRMRRGELVTYVDKQNTKYFTPFNIERDSNNSIDEKNYWDIENYWGESKSITNLLGCFEKNTEGSWVLLLGLTMQSDKHRHGREGVGLSNEVETQALERAFPNREKRLEFLKLFLKFSEAKVKEYKFIDKSMPKLREHHRFVDAKQFKNMVLNGPYKGAKIEVNRISDLISDLEDEINEEIET
ncbi:hypothetical protein C2G38_2050433 [Gigaspora rosea]|uniref:Uncharacterized protein n=1 Tax=Gigaspora rosea TaxID=44941 RepID=A0A397TVU1_9GLOM|nr:hypothetical protein C2G38_2050433 [Gigaspora rosea]